MSKSLQQHFKINNVMDLSNFELIERVELTEAAKIEDRDSYIYLKNKYVASENELFVSFTEIPKLGINPNSKYDTPNGIYSYPLKYYFNVHGKVPFKSGSNSGVRYINVFKPKEIIVNKIIDNSLTESQYQSFIDKIKKDKSLYKIALKNASVAKRFDEYSNEGIGAVEALNSSLIDNIKVYENTAKIKTPLGYLWNVTRLLSAKDNDIIKRNSNAWTDFLIKMGIYGVIDNGEGIIHYNEKTQAVFFNVSFLDVLDRIQDKELNINIRKDKLNNDNILNAIHAFMSYIKAHEAEYDTKATNNFFNIILGDAYTATNYFDANHEDFKLLLIYINLALGEDYDLHDVVYTGINLIIKDNEELIKIFLDQTASLKYSIIYTISKADSNLGILLYGSILKSDYYAKQLLELDPTEMVNYSRAHFYKDYLDDMLLHALYSVHAKKYINEINLDFENFMSNIVSRNNTTVNKILRELIEDISFLIKFVKWLPKNIEDVKFDVFSLYNANEEIRKIMKELIKKDGHNIVRITDNIDSALEEHPELKESVVNYIVNDYTPILTYNSFYRKKGIEIIKYCLQNYPEYRNSFINDLSNKDFHGPEGFLKTTFTNTELIRMHRYTLLEPLSKEDVEYVLDNLHDVNYLEKFNLENREKIMANPEFITKVMANPKFITKVFADSNVFKTTMNIAPATVIEKIIQSDPKSFFDRIQLLNKKEIIETLYHIMGVSDILLDQQNIKGLVELTYGLDIFNDRAIRHYTGISSLYGITMAEYINERISYYISKNNMSEEDNKNVLYHTYHQVIRYNFSVNASTVNTTSKVTDAIPLADINEDFKKYKAEKFPNLEAISTMKTKLRNKLFAILNEVNQ